MQNLVIKAEYKDLDLTLTKKKVKGKFMDNGEFKRFIDVISQYDKAREDNDYEKQRDIISDIVSNNIVINFSFFVKLFYKILRKEPLIEFTMSQIWEIINQLIKLNSVTSDDKKK